MEKFLDPFLEKYNFKAKALPVGRLSGLERDFKKLLDSGLVDKKVYDSYLRGFSFTGPDDLKDLNSIIILSMPRPQHRLRIHFEDRAVEAIIPPTYINYRKTYRDIFKLLKKWLAGKGYGLSQALLPLKLLASRSGLSKYGKNNIAYVGKWGSFHQLAGFYTDWKTEEDPWQELESLAACNSCTLCVDQCPTRAIPKDWFNLDAARCLTFLNESKDDIPTWVKPGSHNSLIGCMRCQLICPYNNKVKDWIEDIGELDHEDIALLAESSRGKKKDPQLVNKFKGMGLYEWLDDIPILRNLRLLADN